MKARFKAGTRVRTSYVIHAAPPQATDSPGTIEKVHAERGQTTRYQVRFDYPSRSLWLDEESLQVSDPSIEFVTVRRAKP